MHNIHTARVLGMLRPEGDLVLKFVVCGVESGERVIRLEDPAGLFGVEDVEFGPGEYFIAAKRVLELQMGRRAPAWLATSFAVHVLLPADDGFCMTGEELDRWIEGRVAAACPPPLRDNSRRLAWRRTRK